MSPLTFPPTLLPAHCVFCPAQRRRGRPSGGRLLLLGTVALVASFIATAAMRSSVRTTTTTTTNTQVEAVDSVTQPPQVVSNPVGSVGVAPTPVDIAAAAGLHRTAPELGPRSRRWAPLVLSTCTPDMQRHWAPCLVGSAKDPGLAYGEEVIYPAFSIPEPGFVTEEHAQKWRDRAHVKAPERFVLRAVDGTRKTFRGIFAAQHGQNLVLKNVLFE